MKCLHWITVASPWPGCECPVDFQHVRLHEAGTNTLNWPLSVILISFSKYFLMLVPSQKRQRVTWKLFEITASKCCQAKQKKNYKEWSKRGFQHNFRKSLEAGDTQSPTGRAQPPLFREAKWKIWDEVWKGREHACVVWGLWSRGLDRERGPCFMSSLPAYVVGTKIRSTKHTIRK